LFAFCPGAAPGRALLLLACADAGRIWIPAKQSTQDGSMEGAVVQQGEGEDGVRRHRVLIAKSQICAKNCGVWGNERKAIPHHPAA